MCAQRQVLSSYHQSVGGDSSVFCNHRHHHDGVFCGILHHFTIFLKKNISPTTHRGAFMHVSATLCSALETVKYPGIGHPFSVFLTSLKEQENYPIVATTRTRLKRTKEIFFPNCFHLYIYTNATKFSKRTPFPPYFLTSPNGLCEQNNSVNTPLFG